MPFLEAICKYPFYNVAPFHLSFLSERFNCVMLCTNLNPLSPACATFLAELCNPITRQAIEVESFSNPLRIQPVLHLKSIKKNFGIGGGFSGGTLQVGVFLATFTWPWAPNPWAIIMAQDFFGNKAKIYVFRTFE